MMMVQYFGFALSWLRWSRGVHFQNGVCLKQLCVNSCPRELCVIINRPTENSTKFERMASDQFWKIAYRNTITFLWIWETFCFQNDDRNLFFKFRNLFFKFRFSIRSFVYGNVWFVEREGCASTHTDSFFFLRNRLISETIKSKVSTRASKDATDTK